MVGVSGHDDSALSLAVQELEATLRGCAEVTREVQVPALNTVRVEPRSKQARSMWLSVTADEVIVEAGEHGGRWEIRNRPDDVAFLTSLVLSVMAGRIRETLGPRRSMVEVTFADGTVVRETGYDSLLPLPGWKRLLEGYSVRALRTVNVRSCREA